MAKKKEKKALEDELKENKSNGEESISVEENKELSIEEKLEILKQENQRLNEKYLRILAEFENYKRRSEADKINWIKYSNEKIILRLCEVLDNFERALQTEEKEHSLKSFKEGVNLIHNQLLKVLKDEGVEKIDSDGKDFNPEFHDALAQTPSDLEKDKVAKTVESGYLMNNKVIRAAKVLVSSGEKEQKSSKE